MQHEPPWGGVHDPAGSRRTGMSAVRAPITFGTSPSRSEHVARIAPERGPDTGRIHSPATVALDHRIEAGHELGVPSRIKNLTRVTRSPKVMARLRAC